MASTPMRGAGIGLPQNPAIYSNSSGSPINAAGQSIFNNKIVLSGGEAVILPAGQWLVKTGFTTFVEYLDPITNEWRVFVDALQSAQISSDGTNLRLANRTGQIIGAVVANIGSSYSSPPTVVDSLGNTGYTAVMGAPITGVTLLDSGSGYTLPPKAYIAPPPKGGRQAVVEVTIAGGIIAGMQVTDQGAGYTSAPTVVVVPDPRDTGLIVPPIGLAAVLGAKNVVIGIAVTGPNPILASNTATPVTFTITGGGGGGAAAIPIMCMSLNNPGAITVTGAGAGYTASSVFEVESLGGQVFPLIADDGDASYDGFPFIVRPCKLLGAASGAGAITGTELTSGAIADPGLVMTGPSTTNNTLAPLGAVVLSGGAAVPTAYAELDLHPALGVWQADVSLIQPI